VPGVTDYDLNMTRAPSATVIPFLDEK